MIISHEEEKITKVEIVDKRLCNCCGNEIYEEAIHISHSFGYWSNYDGEIHNMDICQECYKKFTSTFKIPVEVTEYM